MKILKLIKSLFVLAVSSVASGVGPKVDTAKEIEYDDVTLTWGTNGIQIKDTGVDHAQLKTDAIRTAKIKNGEITPEKLSAGGGVIFHEYADLTESSGTGATLKTHTITGGTLAAGFWVYAYGYNLAGGTSAVTATYTVTVGGTIKGTTAVGRGVTQVAGEFRHAWAIMIYIPAADAHWTPASNCVINVVHTGSGVTAYCEGLVIFGR